jgi:hypothetical protein
MMRIGFAALALCSLVACARHAGSDDEDDSTATLTIDPPSAELLIENSVPAHQDYTATLTFPDGHMKDVTADTVFLIDSGFGSFTDNNLAVGAAGKTQVYGTYIDRTESAELIVRLRDVRVDPALPANTPDLFTNGTEDAAVAPDVVYPPADVIVPRNLGDFETHWTDSHGHDVFEISLHTEFSDIRVYVPGGNGMPGAGPAASYAGFSADEWASAVNHETQVTYQVRGATAASPGVVGAAAPRFAHLTNESMEGGLYYWASTSSAGAYGIFRHDMSKPGQPAEEYMTTNQTSGRCVACHVLSRDGSKLAVTYDGGNGAATLVDVATKAAQGGSNAWNFGTFTPDGNEILTAERGAINVRSYANQSVIATMPASGWATHPDLSADGHKLVYVKPSNPGSDWSFSGGSIVWRTYDQSTHTFGPETPLVSGSGDNFYPSWSPDGEWILFNRSASNANAYNATDATLWVVKADGTQPPISLGVANVAGSLTNSWGRWAPFEQSYGSSNERIYWITVSSKRDFGTRLFGVGRPQLWMTPFFPNRAAAGNDPSAPAFRLPFQNIVSNNHIAQWTERVVITL